MDLEATLSQRNDPQAATQAFYATELTPLADLFRGLHQVADLE